MANDVNWAGGAAVVSTAVRTGDSKHAILEVLGSEFPLTAREIFRRLAVGNSFSYQGIHKSLRQLERSGVVDCESHKYRINASWVLGMKGFSSQILNKYAHPERPEFASMKLYSSSSFEVDGPLLEPVFYVLEECAKLPGKKQFECAMHFHFPWPLPAITGRDYLQLKGLFVHSKSLLVACNCGPLTEIFLKAWRKIGIKCAIASECSCSLGLQTLAVDDFVVQVAPTPSNLAFYEELRELARKKKQSFIVDVLDLAYSKTIRQKMIVTRDPELAKDIRTRAARFFDKKLS